MLKSAIEKTLKSYRYDKGRCMHLHNEIVVAKRQIESEKRNIADELASPHPQQITDMPRGNGISKPTEKYGIMLANGYKSPELIALEEKLSKLEAEYEQCLDTVRYVEAWFSGLSERERWVIKNQFIDELPWKNVVKAYAAKFGDVTSKDTLKRIKDKAMNRIYQMASE